ncbi:MAG TPA: PepSY domain-containing protein [Rhodanobacteraceae bacterium]|nr:PepSY domain-containing protein [Rhodanobacteraceae bacterium]
MTRALSHTFVATLAIGMTAAALAGSIEPGDHLEMAAVLKAQVTPTQAVKIAEAGGGRAYGYGMEATRRGHWYEVEVLRGDAKLELRIDATSGKVIGSRPAHGEDARGAHALDGNKLTFGEAIAQAERVGNGPALEANAAGHGNKAHVEVDVIQDHGKRIAHYHVSMLGGQVKTTLTGTDA